MCPETSRLILPEPPAELKQLSNELTQLIRQKIAEQGSITFSDYMEMALYTPGLGYYSAGLQKFGSGGDFITSPQLGNLFANCLAKQIEQIAPAFEEYTIIEAGAGTGILAADLLKALNNDSAPVRYLILERSAHLRQVQKETLQQLVPEWIDRIEWLDKPPDDPWQGIFLANEVLDALTVERFCVADTEIMQLKIAASDNGFEWLMAECPAPLRDRVNHVLDTLQAPLPDGYRSEININLPAWLKVVTASMQKGVALLIDYGYTREQYYSPQRSDGTLICHYQQRAHGDPFSWPGLTDLSASVDFTAVAEAADQCNLEVSGYNHQGAFLLGCELQQVMHEYADWPAADLMSKNNELRKLTHPDEMGERFQVMALSRGLDEELTENLCGFAFTDWRNRL